MQHGSAFLLSLIEIGKLMNQCPGCGTQFKCGVEEAGYAAPCWCMQLPPLPMSSKASTNGKTDTDACLCPVCLRRRIENFQKLNK
jgi:hypothetical protein